MAQPSQLEYVLDHSDTKLVFFTKDQKDKLEIAASKINQEIELIQIDTDAKTIFCGHDNLSGYTLPEIT